MAGLLQLQPLHAIYIYIMQSLWELHKDATVAVQEVNMFISQPRKATTYDVDTKWNIQRDFIIANCVVTADVY